MYNSAAERETIERVTHLNEPLVFNESRDGQPSYMRRQHSIAVDCQKKIQQELHLFNLSVKIEWTRLPYTAHLMRQIINFSYIYYIRFLNISQIMNQSVLLVVLQGHNE
jgi:hypothetical protein